MSGTSQQNQDRYNQGQGGGTQSSNPGQHGGGFSASVNLPDVNTAGLGFPSIAGIPGITGLFGLPSVSYSQMVWATQQAAAAQLWYWTTANMAEHFMAIGKQVADQMCPPLNQGSALRGSIQGNQATASDQQHAGTKARVSA